MAGEARVNTGLRLLPATLAALDAAAARMGGRSRAFVVEVLAGLYAPRLDADTSVPVGLMPAGSRAKKRPPKPTAKKPKK